MKDPRSYFNLYKKLTALKQTSALENGNLTTEILNDNSILAILRQTEEEGVVLLMNFSNENDESVDLTGLIKGFDAATVYASSLEYNIRWK